MPVPKKRDLDGGDLADGWKEGKEERMLVAADAEDMVFGGGDLETLI